MSLRGLLDHPATKIASLVVALAAVVTIGYEVFKPAPTKTLTAYFPVAVHLYPGSEVDVLGVKVGTVESVTPEGDRVRVVMHYDAGRRLPRDVSAAVGEPTLVADRVIELTPAYGGGPVLPDGATLGLSRTRVPIELDQLEGNLVQLAKALGPDGANRQGALSRALTVAAANLRGEGAAGHTTITRLATMIGTLGDNRNALFGMVRNLQAFTSELAQHDAETRAFTTDLGDVSTQLAADSASFSRALHNLGIGLDEVARFIKANRHELAKDVASLGTLTHTLARERVLLAHIVDMGAVGISNYPHMYTPSARTYNARFDNAMTDNPALFFCQLFGSIGGDAKQCLDSLKPLNKVPLPQAGSRR